MLTNVLEKCKLLSGENFFSTKNFHKLIHEHHFKKYICIFFNCIMPITFPEQNTSPVIKDSGLADI